MARLLSRVALAAALLALLAGAWFSLRLTRADAALRDATPASVERALHILPDSAAALSLRALQIEYDAADPTPLLQHDAGAHPRSSAPRLRLGIWAETHGDLSAAERWLLDAARVDHQYEPAWALANFYFRHNRRDEFFVWMRQALTVSYGDRKLAYDLCWRMAGADEILTRALPEQRAVFVTYVSYLLSQPHPEAIAPAAARLRAFQDASDLPLLESATDALIRSRQPAAARSLWSQLHPGDPTLLFNGGFRTPPSAHGFDWQPQPGAGILHTTLAAAQRVTLSGKQAEIAPLLYHSLLLEKGRRYRLRWESRTTGFEQPTGLNWGREALRVPLEPSADWRPGSVEFVAADAWAPLTLQYARPLGQARAEGTVELRAVDLTAISSPK